MFEKLSSKFMSLVALATLIASVAFAGYQYKEIHLPEFEALKNSVAYQACIQQCIDTCRANGISVDACKCDHCNVYKAH
jgi:hypothetical protein